MDGSENQLKDYFLRELHSLREDATAFARSYPGAAGALALNKGRSNDPQVELLLQSFAYLVGRLQYRMEAGQASLPNTLMDVLHPHLAAPTPTMLVARMDAPQSKGTVLPRWRQMRARIEDSHGKPVDCRFRTCFETVLWPLSLEEIKLSSIEEYPGLRADAQARSVLRVRFRGQGNQSLANLGLENLRFHISGEQKWGYRLYDALALNLTDIVLSIPATDESAPPLLKPLGKNVLSWLGFADEEAALHDNPHSHPGYRLIQEYFAFPEKFMFFDVGGLDLSGAGDAADLLFLLNLPPDRSFTLSPDTLQLNCVPLVNLFSQRIDPLVLDHSHYEYQLRADLQNHRYCEIYAVEELLAIRPDASPRAIAPYYAMEDFRQLGDEDYFYTTRRETSQLPGVAGTELYVSFLDVHFDIDRPADETIGGRALCTNRRLPERLRIGDSLALEGAGAVDAIHVSSKPTVHQTPRLVGDRPWTLASQLALNHLSLADGDDAMASLKEMLRLHLGPSSLQGMRQIDGIRRLGCRPVVRHVGPEGWRGFVQGVHVQLSVDRSHFEEGSAVLFAEVLRRFFALYATVNTVVELALETHDVKGVLKLWPPLTGNQAVL